jgi:hypothetical protein
MSMGQDTNRWPSSCECGRPEGSSAFIKWDDLNNCGTNRLSTRYLPHGFSQLVGWLTVD